jgi:hypothetical protein
LARWAHLRTAPDFKVVGARFIDQKAADRLFHSYHSDAEAA